MPKFFNQFLKHSHEYGQPYCNEHSLATDSLMTTVCVLWGFPTSCSSSSEGFSQIHGNLGSLNQLQRSTMAFQHIVKHMPANYNFSFMEIN